MDLIIFDRDDGTTEFVNMDHVMLMRQWEEKADVTNESWPVIQITFSNGEVRKYEGIDAFAFMDAVIGEPANEGDPDDKAT